MMTNKRSKNKQMMVETDKINAEGCGIEIGIINADSIRVGVLSGE